MLNCTDNKQIALIIICYTNCALNISLHCPRYYFKCWGLLFK
nr:MAG TPA: hypothetical protein [Caudoviricetes sp.]